MVPSLIKVVNKHTITSLAVGQIFCHTTAGMVSGPAPLEGAAEETALEISSGVIGAIGSWLLSGAL